MSEQVITIEGKRFVLVEQSEWNRLKAAVRDENGSVAVMDGNEADLPPLPSPDQEGHYPAAEATRTLMARDIITLRRAAGLSQTQLAEQAGVRLATIQQLEMTGEVSQRAIEKIDAALQAHCQP